MKICTAGVQILVINCLVRRDPDARQPRRAARVTISANRSSSPIPPCAAITTTTLCRANEQYRPASRNHGRPVGVDPEVEQAVVAAAERDVAAPGRLPHRRRDRVVDVDDPGLAVALRHQAEPAVVVPGELVGRRRGSAPRRRRRRTPPAAGRPVRSAVGGRARSPRTAPRAPARRRSRRARADRARTRRRSAGPSSVGPADERDTERVVGVDRLDHHRERDERAVRSPGRSTSPVRDVHPGRRDDRPGPRPCPRRAAMTSGGLPTYGDAEHVEQRAVGRHPGQAEHLRHHDVGRELAAAVSRPRRRPAAGAAAIAAVGQRRREAPRTRRA